MTVSDRPLSYWITLARMGFEEDLARLMGKKDISRSELARKVGVSPQFITKVLNGTNNYTLATMAKLARGIAAVLEVRLADEGSEVVRVVDPAVAVVIDAMRDVQAQPHGTEIAPVTSEVPTRKSNILSGDFEPQGRHSRMSPNQPCVVAADYKAASGG
jgi:transcriptional regulator with XRE-family HTH domain